MKLALYCFLGKKHQRCFENVNEQYRKVKNVKLTVATV
jgi:hypothetical protein